MRFLTIILILGCIQGYPQQPKLILPVGHTDRVVFAEFSPDGKTIVTASNDNTAKIWDANTGKLLIDLNGHTNHLNTAKFSPDGKKIISASWDNTAKVWDAKTGTQLLNLRGHRGWVSCAEFSADGKKILTASWDSTARIWDAITGKLLSEVKQNHAIWSAHFGLQGIDIDPGLSSRIAISKDNSKKITIQGNTATITDAGSGKSIILSGHSGYVEQAGFSYDGKKVVTASEDSTAKIWDVATGALLAECGRHTYRVNSEEFSSDGKKIVSTYWNNTVKVWDVETSTQLIELKGHTDYIKIARFSPDNKKIITASQDGTAKIWDANSGNILGTLKGHTSWVNSARFSPDGKRIITASSDGTIKIWDASTYNLLHTLKSGNKEAGYALYSPNGNIIVTDGNYGGVKIWDTKTYTLLFNLDDDAEYITSIQFSKDGRKIGITSHDETGRVWDPATGKLVYRMQNVGYLQFSPDGTKIATASDSSIMIWNAGTGKMIDSGKGHTSWINSLKFSPDGKKIVTASTDQTAILWDAFSGTLLFNLKGHNSLLWSAQFSPDGKNILTSSNDNTSKIWNASTGKLLYTFFGVDKIDHLIVDAANHYDGSEAARKLIYFSCGYEIISLDQVKDKLWVPNLAKRINKGEIINSAGLEDLNICHLVPIIERIENKSGYQYKITPQRGGIGSTYLFVNDIETKKYELQDLKKLPDGYELYVSAKELEPFFGSNSSNHVTIRSFTSENDIASRSGDGDDGEDEKKITDTTAVNLFAVFIGISDYKGKDLTLKFAAKDAVNLSNAVALSSSKFLGKNHVLIYNLNTSETRDNLPEKKSIREAFTDIGKKATANDILMIFFAGHGVLEGESKQLYLLTAEASPSSITPNGVKEVGISAAELMDWIKPLNIKTQKRILILDACHSGSAINDIVSLGKDQGFAVRNDDKAEEIKQIDKLNEKSGLYVLAASASNQSAYELVRYGQGILTYSLLKALKEHPEILEQNKFLNVSGWFNSAVKIANDIAREIKKEQEPQLVTMTDFNIGIVDREVLSKIILSGAKSLFVASAFQNDEDYDELDIAKAVNKQLNDVSTRGAEGAISFTSSSDSPDAYIINGRYNTKGDAVTIKINIKQSKEKAPKYRYEIVGKKSNINKLAEIIVTKALATIK